ncbi:TlpA disulfide reductase family protein [Sulfuriferula sp.]|uniref:TlpA family protein disulfide reductase n=1 Tax=Sulfuriferula sp. TaxID=2025307 RepID=UPI00272FB870|nr:TlpA disulfide reductase family protein [Sulfuriferula sp.]MDP2027101.1 TlpA disulfide reductase family protein [Sulfuriferula sp.]
MIKNPLTFIAAMPRVIRRGWRGLSIRKRTVLALAIWVLAWQGVLGGLRLMENPALSAMQLTTLVGESTDLAALADGKPMVVNLWASWCPPCRREMPVLAAAQKRETWVSFVFANQGENGMTVQRYLSASQLDLANVMLDRDTRLGFVAGSMVLPITLFYDANGRLVDSRRGELSAAALASKLNQLRAHKSPE